MTVALQDHLLPATSGGIDNFESPSRVFLQKALRVLLLLAVSCSAAALFFRFGGSLVRPGIDLENSDLPPPEQPVSIAGKSIYFLLVDRFARSGSDASDDTLCDYTTPHEWLKFGGRCGGTFQGVIDKIDYIKGMGFDCIWITPIIHSADYTGYLAEDFDAISSHLGGAEDFAALVQALHANDMCIVLDIVLNHVRPMVFNWVPDDFSAWAPIAYLGPETIMPFNDPSHYHMYGKPPDIDFRWWIMLLGPAQVGESLGSSAVLQRHVEQGLVQCGPENIELTLCLCMPGNGPPHCPGNNVRLQEEGWFSSLADLNQSDPFVREALLQYVRRLRSDFGVDAFRLDTAIYMPQDFLAEAQQAAGVDIFGEATVSNLTYHASFQDNVLSGLLNFPAFYQVPQAFCQMVMEGSFSDFSKQGAIVADPPNLTRLALVVQAQQRPGLYRNPDLLGQFLDNHDEFSRIHHYCQNDVSRIKNALTWLMLTRGTPIVYYGTEQGFAGHQVAPMKNGRMTFSNQAWIRTSLWQTKYNTSTWQYLFIASLNRVRKKNNISVGDQRFRFVDERRMVFTRTSPDGKDVWVFLNNFNQSQEHEPVTYCPGPPLDQGDWQDDISGVRATLKDGCFVADDAAPKVLVQLDRKI